MTRDCICQPAVRRRQGMSLVEVSLSALLTGVLLVAALQAVGQSVLSQTATALNNEGRVLAEGLLAEIVTRAYREPDGDSTLGRDVGEAPPRVNFDDVDDYHGYDESPPESRLGAALAGHTLWRRQVRVEWVDALTPSAVSGVETGAKRIIVTASFNGTVRAEAVAVRCDVP